MVHFRLVRRVALVSAALFLAGCGGWTRWEQARFTRTDALTASHVSRSALDVDVANGFVEVSKGQGDAVTIEAVIRATTQERLDATHVVLSREPDSTLKIRVDWADGVRKSSEGCSLTIAMPDAGPIALASSNGRLSVVGVGSDARLRTSNGRVTVHHIEGSVDARTSNGRVELHGIPGQVYVDSSNGALELIDVAGRVQASTSNGGIRLQLAETNTGPVDATSSNGAVHIELGQGFAGELSLETSNGHVHIDHLGGAELVEMGKRSARLRFAGESVGSSRVHTSNGSITVSGPAGG